MPDTTYDAMLHGPQRVHKPIEIPIKDTAHWLTLREGFVGGTDAPALMQGLIEAAEADRIPDPVDGMDEDEDDEELEVSPYQTIYGLWAMKSGLYKPKPKSNSRINYGNLLEGPIAQAAAERNEWTIRKAPAYYKHPYVERMGVSLDYEIETDLGAERAWIPLEVKNVAWLERWKWRLNGFWQPPPHIVIQVQAQLSVTGMPYAYLTVLFGGSEPRDFRIDRDEEVIRQLEAAVIDFWQHVDDGIPPEPDYERDRAVIKHLYARATEGKVVDWSENEEAKRLVAALQYETAAIKEHNAIVKAHQEEADILKTKLLELIGDAEMADVGGIMLKATTVKGATVSFEREPYRRISVAKKKKPKK